MAKLCRKAGLCLPSLEMPSSAFCCLLVACSWPECLHTGSVAHRASILGRDLVGSVGHSHACTPGAGAVGEDRFWHVERPPLEGDSVCFMGNGAGTQAFSMLPLLPLYIYKTYRL